MDLYQMWWIIGLCAGFMVVGICIGWQCWGEPLKRQAAEVRSAARYRDACRDVLMWCGQAEFRPARLVTAHIMAIGEGETINAGTPTGDEPCTIDGMREQLRRINRETPNAGDEGAASGGRLD